jgi:hypothetical protein
VIPAAAIFAVLLTVGSVQGLAGGSASLPERGAAPAASPSAPAIVSSNVASGDTSWSTAGTETLFSAGLPSVDAGGSVLAFVDISGWYPGMVSTLSDSLGNALRPVDSGTVGSDYLALYAIDGAAGGTNDVIRASGPVSNGTSYGWVLLVASLYPTVRPSVNDYSVDYSESGTTTSNATVAPTLALYAQIVDYGPTVFSSHSPASMLTYGSDSFGLTSLGVSYENVSSVGPVSMSMTTNSGDSPVVGLLVLLDDIAPSTPHWAATGACAPNHTGICVPLLGGTTAPKNLDPNIVTCARNSGVSGGCEPLFGTDPNTGAFYVWANDEYGLPSIPDDTVGWEWQNGSWGNVTAGSNVQVFGYTLGDSYGTPTCMAWDPEENGFIAVASNNTYPANPGWTYLYAGGHWTNLSYSIPFKALPPGGGHGEAGTCSMVWDPADHELVLVFTSTVNFQDYPEWTWTFGGSGWTNISATAGYPNLYTEEALGMAWDPSDAEVVLEGAPNQWGTDGEGPATTYTFSAGRWTNWTWMSPQPPGDDGGQFISTWGNGVVELGGDNLSSFCYWSPYVWYWQDNRWTNITPDGNWPLNGNCDGSGSLRIYDPVTGVYDSSGNYYSPIGGEVGPDTIVTFGGSGIFSSFFANAMNATAWCLSGLSSCLPFALPSPSGTWSNQVGLPCSAARLEWVNPTPPNGTTLVNDTVYVYAANGTIAQKVSTGGAATSVVVYGLACNSLYSFSVQAWYSSGAASPLSGALSFLTASAPGAIGLSFPGGSAGAWLLLLVVAVTVLATAVWLVSRRSKRSGGRRIGSSPWRFGGR